MLGDLLDRPDTEIAEAVEEALAEADSSATTSPDHGRVRRVLV